ncbi:hypothetical protein [Bacillus sp. JCM 19041]|uniref:hypothetical protein n=1 Tax=Bacillus sp. JCM 19041 TaxID=1460637 RepID=UPI000B2E4CDE
MDERFQQYWFQKEVPDSSDSPLIPPIEEGTPEWEQLKNALQKAAIKRKQDSL